MTRQMVIRVVVCCAAGLWAAAASAQWNPAQGQWGKSEPTDIRIMTWNVEDGICSSNTKQENLNNWTAIARIVAAMKPDVLILQETGDNVGNGTGAFVDSPVFLEMTLDMFFRGGEDIFNPPQMVTSWVQKYDPAFDMPHYFVSTVSDGFNRNLIVSRFPFADLNGDGRIGVHNATISSDAYSPGGNFGVRGFQFVEIDLPDDMYAGDLVVGNGHLKAFSDASSQMQRIVAAQNIAYYIDYLFNGAGTGMPDPNAKISQSPPATMVLDANTPVIWGGDFNEDELTNGRKGPARWMVEAAVVGGTDGTDRDRTDSMYDDARDFFTNNRATRGSAKLDYIAWQDSVAQLRRSFIFRTDTLTGAAEPPEILSFGLGSLLSNAASDHRPVIADFILPLRKDKPCPWDFDGDGSVGSSDLSALLGSWGDPYTAGDLSALLGSWGACP